MNPQQLISFVSDGFDKAKGGDAVAIYNRIVPHHDKGTLPLKSHYPFGWIIYYALHQSDEQAIEERKRMLARYLKLSVAKPHKLHSMILTEAIRLYRDSTNINPLRKFAAAKDGSPLPPTFSIVSFLDLWGPANLRPGDRRRKEHEGNKLESTAERLLAACCDELEEKHLNAPPRLLNLIDQTIAEYPDSSSLLAGRATLHNIAGERDKAVALLRSALLCAPGKFYLWSRLATLIDPEKNPRLHIALLYKALIAPGRENFKGRIRLGLAQAWCAINSQPYSLWELRKARTTYESNGWHLPRLLQQLEKEIPEGCNQADPTSVYQRIEAVADDFLYETLPAITVKKNYHKTPHQSERYGRKRIDPAAWRVNDEQGNNYWLTPSRHGIDDQLPVGTKLKIRIHNGKVVKASL